MLEAGGALSGDIVSRHLPQVPASEEINNRPDRSTSVNAARQAGIYRAEDRNPGPPESFSCFAQTPAAKSEALPAQRARLSPGEVVSKEILSKL